MLAAKEQNSQPAPAGDCNLPQTIQIISSLICVSHSIKVFNGKWQLIRNKLEQLNSTLTSLTESCSSCQETALSIVIQSIIATATECRDLARRCTELSYSGKLLMQSDLDIVIVKFEYSIKDLNEIYTRAHAIVVSRPGPGACSTDVKFYVGELATRIKIGSWETKREALFTLNEILHEDETNVGIVVEMGEIVRLLVDFLEFTETETQEESTKAVLVIAGYDSYTSVLMGAGVLAPLIRVLEFGSDVAKERATMALQKLTENSDCAWLVSAHGGITVLLKVCDCNRNWQLVGLACGVLRNLASIDEVKRFLIREGLISAIVRLSRSEDEATQIGAIEFLQEIASGDEHVRKIIVNEGGIESLIGVLDTKSSQSSKSQEAALSAINSLCLSSPSSVNALTGPEFLNCVRFLMQRGEASVQEMALKIAYQLCGGSNDAKKAMGELGFMQELAKFLNAESLPIREMAAEALCHISSIPKNRKKFIEEHSNVAHVTELLNSWEENSDKEKSLLSSMKSLVHSNTKKMKITASGIVDYLERLAVTEVKDAKRIVKKFSENRFRKILTGIWGAKM